jgi:hypothetical protein
LAGGVAQAVKHLRSKFEALSSKPSSIKKERKRIDIGALLDDFGAH